MGETLLNGKEKLFRKKPFMIRVLVVELVPVVQEVANAPVREILNPGPLCPNHIHAEAFVHCLKKTFSSESVRRALIKDPNFLLLIDRHGGEIKYPYRQGRDLLACPFVAGIPYGETGSVNWIERVPTC